MPTLPRVLVFDLDGCCWNPEMYQLWGGGGAPFREDGDSMIDRGGNRVSLIGDVRALLSALMNHDDVRAGHTRLCTASTCDEPEWARELLRKFTLECPRTRERKAMGDVFHSHQIFSAGNKHEHFHNIKSATGVDFKDMMFFDNQMNNIRDVGRLGVNCVYTPNGVTHQEWCQFLPRLL